MAISIYTLRHTGQVSQAQKATKPGAAFNSKGEPRTQAKTQSQTTKPKK